MKYEMKKELVSTSRGLSLFH